LALSPSCSIALILGSIAMGWANEAERALAWGERAVRLSPFDRLSFGAHIGLAVGHFSRDRYEEAVSAARDPIQSRVQRRTLGLGRVPCRARPHPGSKDRNRQSVGAFAKLHDRRDFRWRRGSHHSRSTLHRNVPGGRVTVTTRSQ
jgi:hypothetical protein